MNAKWLLAFIVLAVGLGLLGVAATRNAGFRRAEAPAEAGRQAKAPGEGSAVRSIVAHDVAERPSPVVALRLEPLRAPRAADPGDRLARRQLAVALLAENRLLEAFEEASELLRADPDDPDGLYVHGVVRLAMGQGRRAIALLDRVVARHPDHVAAWTARGKAHLKTRNLPMAIASWERGLAAAGGRHAEIEALLLQAREGSGQG